MAPLRIGILGAARIAPAALVRPGHAEPGVEVAAVAARDRTRAATFAARHGIPIVHDSYTALLDDPRVDAVYNPLPNGLHGRWTIAAIEAGKHVLCEKPFTANAEEAAEVAAAAEGRDVVVMEAFHWRYHPMATRILELVEGGAIGELRSAGATVCFPNPSRSDIRWQLDLAGGALMDVGCYPVHMLRHLAGRPGSDEPTVRTARAWERWPGVDRLVEAELEFGSGVTARLRTSMWSRHLAAISVDLIGTSGRLRAMNPLAPQYLSWLRVRGRDGSWRERPPRSATYLHQLRAFRDAVTSGAPPLTGPADATANMAVIDAIYRAAGMEPRRPTPV